MSIEENKAHVIWDSALDPDWRERERLMEVFGNARTKGWLMSYWHYEDDPKGVTVECLGRNLANVLMHGRKRTAVWVRNGVVYSVCEFQDGRKILSYYREAQDREAAEFIMDVAKKGKLGLWQYRVLTRTLYPYIAGLLSLPMNEAQRYAWERVREPETVDDIPF